MKNAMTTTVTMRATVTPTRARARGTTRGTTTKTRAVDVGVATAVAQQDLALAVCVISEAVMTRERVAEGTPGRPDLGFVGRGSGALVGAFALIQSDNELATPTGLVLAAAATLGQRKGDPGNALDLGRGVEVGVKRPEAATFNRLNPARLGKKRTAAELAYHDHIGLFSQAFSKRCGVDQGGITPCRPQAGIHIESLAQAHQAVFILRSTVDLDLIPFRTTDGAHQHSIGPDCFVHGIVSAEHTVLVVGRTAQ